MSDDQGPGRFMSLDARAPCATCGRPAAVRLPGGRLICGRCFARDRASIIGARGGERQPLDSPNKPEGSAKPE